MTITTKKLNTYLNGGYKVCIYEDGTKVRECFDSDIKPEFPESIDIKVTDYCDLGCKFCHENSTIKGRHSNLEFALKLFKGLPAGVELAIGGGNPMSWPDLTRFLSAMKKLCLVCNLTINGGHVSDNIDELKNLTEGKYIYGLGISYIGSQSKHFIECIKLANFYPNTVFHLIMGVHSLKDLDLILQKVENPKILLLGYKQHGRGLKYFGPEVDKNLKEWYRSVDSYFGRGAIISFDNLGIKQMNLRRFFSKEKWNEFFMGNDGQFTFYIDLVKEEYAISSTSKNRHKIEGKNAAEMFQSLS